MDWLEDCMKLAKHLISEYIVFKLSFRGWFEACLAETVVKLKIETKFIDSFNNQTKSFEP